MTRGVVKVCSLDADMIVGCDITSMVADVVLRLDVHFVASRQIPCIIVQGLGSYHGIVFGIHIATVAHTVGQIQSHIVRSNDGLLGVLVGAAVVQRFGRNQQVSVCSQIAIGIVNDSLTL